MNRSSGIHKAFELAGLMAAGVVILLAAASLLFSGSLGRIFSPGASLDGTSGAAVNILYLLSALTGLIAGLALAVMYLRSSWAEARVVATGGHPSRWDRYAALAGALVVCLVLGHQLPRIVFSTSNVVQLVALYPLESLTLRSIGGLVLGVLIYALAVAAGVGTVAAWMFLTRRRQRQQFQRALAH
jgi:hypothetical protein